MPRLPLSFACWDYDRVQSLQTGRVRPEGIDLNFLCLDVEETFFRALHNQEFDVCELSLSSYTLTLDSSEPPFIAIPVFPSRFFRHQSIYVNTDRVSAPADLVGKRIGVPEYQLTACVWQRGILADEYDVPIDSVEYLSGALTDAGRRSEKVPLNLPPNLSVTPIADGKNLSDMLAGGEIDALYTARAPHTFGTSAKVAHLFPNYREVEKDYYARTRIFPIMHVIALNRDTHHRHPWIARSLLKAFTEAQQHAYTALKQTAALKYMLPWLPGHYQETVDALGEGYWDYGLDRNRHVLETFTRYSHEQGLAGKLRSPEELFVPGVDEGFLI